MASLPLLPFYISLQQSESHVQRVRLFSSPLILSLSLSMLSQWLHSKFPITRADKMMTDNVDLIDDIVYWFNSLSSDNAFCGDYIVSSHDPLNASDRTTIYYTIPTEPVCCWIIRKHQQQQPDHKAVTFHLDVDTGWHQCETCALMDNE